MRLNRLLILAGVLLVISSSTSYADLIAHYNFEPGSALGLDSAGGNNTGTPQGPDSSLSSLARVGAGSLALDGTGTGLRVDSPEDFASLTNFTIAGFVRPDLDSATWGGGTVQVGRIFGALHVDGPGGTRFGDGFGYGFGLLRDGTEAGFRYTTYTVQDYNVTAASLDSPVQDDEWTHIALVVNSGNAEFFIDGSSVATIEGSNPELTTSPFHIGASGGGDSDSFAGFIDDLRVYDEALDAASIANLADVGGSGQQGLTFSIDRDTGSVSLTNDSSAALQMRGYSLFSEAGRLDADSWLSIAENYDQGNGGATIDPDDDWLEFSRTTSDLSEGTQGEVNLAGAQSVDLGQIWRRGPFEDGDLSTEVLLANGSVVPASIEFTGNNGEPYKVGDLDFDGDVDLDDFATLNAGLFTPSIDPNGADPYLMGDLDGDLDTDFADFVAFKEAFLAEGGNPAALSLGSAVPEPSSLVCLGLAVAATLASCRLRRGGLAGLVAILVVGGISSSTKAALEPVLQYSFPASYDGSSREIIDLSSAGNNATMDTTTLNGPLVDDRPAGFDTSLMSLSGSNGGHGATDAIDLLNNSYIDDFGGFVMDVWMKWEGTYTDARKQIDYAGTEYIRTLGTSDIGTNVVFGLSDGAVALTHPIAADQWYHVRGVFHSGDNQTDVNGDLAGDAYLLVNGQLVNSALDITKTAFGDSLDRPISINRWAGGDGDWNQGAIFNPAVYVGTVAVPEPASIALLGVAILFILNARRPFMDTLVRSRLLWLVGAAVMLLPNMARAQFTPVFEYRFPPSYDASAREIIDLSAAGNNATMDTTTNGGPLVDDRPAGFDSSLMSITGSNGGHGQTDGIDLLENSVVDDHGGFLMDVWIKWEGNFTDGRKILDYAGTEWLRTSGTSDLGTNIVFSLSNADHAISHPIAANEWYHVQAVFDSGDNQTDAGGNLPGDAYLYVDGELAGSALGIRKTAFGDSLDRPIGINRWAGGGGEWNQGWIFNPAVYLGNAEEPMRLEVNASTGEAEIVHLPNSLLPDEREIDFYQITSASGALVTSGWTSLEESGIGASGGGDYNNDGSIDAADYTVWRDSLGSSGAGLAADGDGDNDVDADDYLVWKDSAGSSSGGAGWIEAGSVDSSIVGESFLTGSTEFDNGMSVSLGQLWDENSAASPAEDLVFQYHVVGEEGLRTGAIDVVSSGLLQANAVPEPSTCTIVLLGVAATAIFSRRRRYGSLATLAFAVSLLSASIGSASVTVDRLYLMGEGDGDGGAPGVYVSDSSFQATFDEEYDSGNLSGTAHDLSAYEFDGGQATIAPSGGGPRFVNVSGRPLAGGGTQLGVEFDGTNDMLLGARLGLPQTSASSATPNTSIGSGGPFDYSGITHRGFQLWVNPDESSPVFGSATQAVVLDTNQHGVLISDSGTWMLRYDNVNIDSGAAVKSDATDNGWSHVMVVTPDDDRFGGGGRLYIDGEAVAARRGGYLGTNDFPLVVGASNGAFDPAAQSPDPVFAGGTANYFAGAVDNLEMFVSGTTLSGIDYGSFDLLQDNDYIADQLAGYTEGDLTGDGQVTDTDVSAFVSGWGTVNAVSDEAGNSIPVGDLSSRLAGDFDLNGIVGLEDWQILAENYAGSASLNLPQLLAGSAVPEPSSVTLALCLAGVGVALRFRK